MKHLRLATLLILSTVGLAQPAKAEWTVSAVGGFSLANQSYSDRTANNQAQVKATVNAENFLSYGLQVHHKFEHETYGLTLGLLSTEMGSKVKSFQHPTTRNYTEKIPYYMFPVTFDYYVHPQIMLGAGAYYAMVAGDVVVDGNINGMSSYFTTTEASRAGYKATDYGFVLHANGKQHIAPKWFLTADLSYLMGLSNISTIGGGTISNSTFLIQFGLGFAF